MISYTKLVETFKRLNDVTNLMADEVKAIRTGMEGKGVSPREAPIIMDRLNQIEGMLRQFGSDYDNPVPFK